MINNTEKMNVEKLNKDDMVKIDGGATKAEKAILFLIECGGLIGLGYGIGCYIGGLM